MVDAVVSMVVQKATEYIAQEAAFLGGVKNEVEWLKRELKWMQCFIKDAERKGDRDHRIRLWISEVREIAYETEDVLDDYMLKFHEEETANAANPVVEGGASQKQPGCLSCGLKCSLLKCKKKYNFFRKGKDLYGIGKEIESLKERITELSRQRRRYGLEEDIGSNKETRSSNAHMRKLKQQRRSTPSRVERNVVGLEDETAVLLAKLVDDEDPHRRIISIRGMGGLGKTTIAGKLYHNERVQKRFKHRAWVYVSHDYTTRDLLLQIAKSLKIEKEDLVKMSEDDLEEQIQQYLEGNSYLLVMDDVWETKVWKILKVVFPDDMVGSRVIITTRELEVAKGSDKRFHFHQLRTLKPDESLQLFAEEAYGNRSHRLGNWEMEMVERCGGLPLAIVVLAGLFLAKGSSQHWQEIRRSLREDDSINNLLALSFDDLSCHLKLCFLYLGLFPEDSVIKAEDVIRLWVAEGLIEQEDELISEDVAVEYLNELANRSLIQVEGAECGRIVDFRLHDLLRDIAIRKGKEINFINIDNTTTSPVSSSASCRRQAVYHGVERYLSIENHNHRLRSLLIFNDQNRDLEELSRHLSKRFKLLRVLRISSVFSFEKKVIISEDIKNLILLRYLKFENYGIKEIPSSIANLKNLQTLEVIGAGPTYPIKLHNEICGLKELRHLIIGVFKVDVAVDNLTKLITLRGINYQNWKKNNAEKLINLRELEIKKWDGDGSINTAEFPLDSIVKLKSLLALEIVFMDMDTSLDLLEPLSNCQNLRRLTLFGRMELPNETHNWLPNLEQLLLTILSEVRDDPMPILEKLQNLQMLHMGVYNYRGPRRIVCTSEGFPQLQVLHFEFLRGEVDEWQVEEGAMPNLRELRTSEHHRSIIPERLLSITRADD